MQKNPFNIQDFGFWGIGIQIFFVEKKIQMEQDCKTELRALVCLYFHAQF
jgi:hypothetical protein